MLGHLHNKQSFQFLTFVCYLCVLYEYKSCCVFLQCMYNLVDEAPFIYTSDLDNVVSLCFRALDGSNYDVRCDVAKLLGHVLATALNPPKAHTQGIMSYSLNSHKILQLWNGVLSNINWHGTS